MTVPPIALRPAVALSLAVPTLLLLHPSAEVREWVPLTMLPRRMVH